MAHQPVSGFRVTLHVYNAVFHKRPDGTTLSSQGEFDDHPERLASPCIPTPFSETFAFIH